MSLVTHYATINGIGSRIYCRGAQARSRDGEGQSAVRGSRALSLSTGIPGRLPDGSRFSRRAYAFSRWAKSGVGNVFQAVGA